MSEDKNGAIGVFDSGVGGLTVLRELVNAFPHERFVYLADTARLPYGSKSLHTIRQYAEQNAKALSPYGLKALVVACNSASTAILDQPLRLDVPVFNVVVPGSRKAVETSHTGKIGVLGTRATVLSEAYARCIRALKADAEVVQQACPLFVPLVEEGWIDDPVTNLIVFRYVQPLLRAQVDTVVMGCTHYPVLAASLRKALGPAVTLVDSTSGLREDLLAAGVVRSNATPSLKILVTDFSPRLQEMIQLLLGGLKVDSLETIDV